MYENFSEDILIRCTLNHYGLIRFRISCSYDICGYCRRYTISVMGWPCWTTSTHPLLTYGTTMDRTLTSGQDRILQISQVNIHWNHLETTYPVVCCISLCMFILCILLLAPRWGSASRAFIAICMRAGVFVCTIPRAQMKLEWSNLVQMFILMNSGADMFVRSKVKVTGSISAKNMFLIITLAAVVTSQIYGRKFASPPSAV